MPKKVAKIDQFKTGANSIQDPRDLPEGAVVDALNVMTDVEGKVRQMARDVMHPLNASFDGLNAIVPGYGFFCFRADNRVSGNIDEIEGQTDVETAILVYGANNNISFFDTGNSSNVLALGGASGGTRPVYYYSAVDGGLRVTDANYDNLNSDDDDNINFLNSNFATRYFKFMNKSWFAGSGVANAEVNTTGDYKGWITNGTEGLDSFIYPPTVDSAVSTYSSEANRGYNLVYQHATGIDEAFSASNMSPGNIGIRVQDSGASEADSDWLAGDYNFGVSFVYEGGQESSVSSWNTDFHLTQTGDGEYITLQVFVCTGGHENGFDPRMIGCNIYLTGDDAGLYDDPYFLAEFYWGSSETDPPRLTNSDGKFTEAFTWSPTDGVIFNTTALKIHKTPVITYSMRNGFRSDTESMACNAKTSVITNRRCYAGNLRRYKFDIHNVASDDINGGQNATWLQPAIKKHSSFVNNDLMIVSPVDKYDIFPDENNLEIGSNDGDHIVLLLEYSDRLLQFKKNKLYIINISEDLEFIESEHNFMGINHPYQATKISDGVVWVNNNGCYFYNGEEIVNLIAGKIGENDELSINSQNKFPSFSQFVNNNAMIGYIPQKKHIVIFRDPSSSDSTGDILVYDMVNEGWSRGLDRVTPLIKSNIITNYDNTLLYASPVNESSEKFGMVEYKSSQPSSPEIWVVNAINSSEIQANANGSQLLIGTTPIMEITNYPDGTSGDITFAQHLVEEIESYTPEGFSVDVSGENLIISLVGKHLLDYTGKSLSWSTGNNLAGDTMGAPITDTAFTISPLVSDPGDVSFYYNDLSGAGEGVGLTYLEGTNFSDTNTPFDHCMHLHWSSGPKRFAHDVIHSIAQFAFMFGGYMPTHLGGNTLDTNEDDEPRIKINKASGNYTFADTTTASEVVIDLWSKEFATNYESYKSASASQFHPGGNTIAHSVSPFNVPHDFGGDCDPIQESVQYDSPWWANSNNMYLFYAAAPKEDGSGEATGGSVDNGSVLKTYYNSDGTPNGLYTGDATITLPSMIWLKVSQDQCIILIPGAHAGKFVAGKKYTFSNTGKASNNKSLIIDNVVQHRYDPIHGDESEEDYRTLTVIQLSGHNNNTTDFNALTHWTTFNDVSVAGPSAFATIGESILGRKGRKQELLFFPKRHDNRDNFVEYLLSVKGQDNHSYSLSYVANSTSFEYLIQNNFDANLKRAYRDRPTGITPWFDTHTLSIPGARGLFASNGLFVQTTGSIASDLTSPFSVTLATGLDLSQIVENLNVGEILLARQGTTYEAMKITSISGTAVVVSRDYQNFTSTGNAIAFSGTVDWYKLNVVRRINATTIKIFGGDYTKVFQNGVQFWMWGLGNDTSGANAWTVNADVYANGVDHHIVLSSSYDSGATTILINSGLTYADASFSGADGSYYIRVPSNDADNWKPNMAGDMPDYESISGTAFVSLDEGDYSGPTGHIDAGYPTIASNGMGVDDSNKIITVRSQHMIANSSDLFQDLVAGTYVVTGLKFKQFNNKVSEANTSHCMSSIYPAQVITRDLVLDDDLYTKKVVYNVMVTYKYSGTISATAIINGNIEYPLVLSNSGFNLSSFPSGGSNQKGNASPSAQSIKQTSGVGSANIVFSAENSNNSLPWQSAVFQIGTTMVGSSVSSYHKNIRTIQFRITGLPGGYGFELNDISVAYRSLDVGR